MSYSLFSTSVFDKELKHLAKKYTSIKSDLIILSESLQKNPLQGKPLGKDCYKIRMIISSKGRGKRGSGRVITCVKITGGIIFLLSVYDKSEKEKISDIELDYLLRMAGL